MSFAATWTTALRFVASALVFESALSFRPVVQHRHVVPAECGQFFSSLLKSSGSGARQASNGLLGPDRLQAEGNRQRQRRRGVPLQQQPSLVMMLAGMEGGDSSATAAPEAGGVTRAGEAVGVPQVAGSAPPSGAEHQVSSSAPAVAVSAPKEGAAQASRRRRQQHHHDSDFLFEQKLESVRAALLCGAVGAASRLLAVGAGAFVPGAFLRELLATPEPAAASVLFGLAAGFAQGALFGLTYRYVVRSDRETPPDASGTPDPSVPIPQMDGFTVGHLGDGAVAAFALTSALGQSEVPLTLAAGEFVAVLGRGGGIVEAFGAVILPAAPFLPRVAGDLFLYSVARAALDRALDRGAIKPFP
eukprot:g4848.t1